MRNLRSVAGSTAIVTCLIGCAAQQPLPPMAAAPAASTAATPAAAAAATSASGGLDGVYRPPAGGAIGNSGCGTTRFNFPIRVADGTASMQTVSQGLLTGQVAPDGSLTIENGRAQLRGRFADGRFDGVYGLNRCSFALNYAKR